MLIGKNNVKSHKRRKVGRPKKRGPKKKRIRKKIIKVIKPRPVIDFKIVSMLNNKQNGYVGSYHTYNDAFNRLCELEKENENIIFPRKFLNSGNIKKIKDEYLLLERDRYNNKTETLLRNEYGKFVKQTISNNKNWIVRNKIIKQVEETFWVYGFDPKIDRKTFSWIYNFLILNNIKNSHDIIRILIYKNKLIIKYDDKPMSIIMCKNQSDSIRLYNVISDNIKLNKLKQVIFLNSYNKINEQRRILEKEIQDLTGWNKTKIQRSTN